MGNKNWSKEEIKFAYDNYKSKNLTIPGIANRLGRTEWATATKISEINVKGYDVIYNKALSSTEIKTAKTRTPRIKAKSQTKIKTDNKKSFSLFWGLFKWN